LGNNVEAKLSYKEEKQEVIVKHSANKFEKQEVTGEQLANHWSRLFGSLKRKEDKFKVYISVTLYVKVVNVFSPNSLLLIPAMSIGRI
jgi:hypothetical protein